MNEPWAFVGGPPADGVGEPAITLIDGSTFCISDRNATIDPRRAHGLFVGDTRIVSQWALGIDGTAPIPLTVQHDEPFTATFIGCLAPPEGFADSSALIVRSRYVGNGMREDITIHNPRSDPGAYSLSLQVAADLADLFEVKDGRAPAAAAVGFDIDGADLRAVHDRNGRTFGAIIRIHAGSAILALTGATWSVEVPAHGSTTTTIEVLPLIDGQVLALHHAPGQPVDHALPARKLRAWRRDSPSIETIDETLAAVLRRSVDDLGALRIFDPDHPERAVVAAGAPWFMALFGRDSLLTSWMLLPLDASLALGTLQTLADRQGNSFDDASEEEPGRIPHETRFGPATELALGGRTVYYGTADATALFVMLVGELNRWGGQRDAALALRPHAERALRWMEQHGDADGDGFIEYARKTDKGLVNQGWKDSWDGINFADGRLAEAPIALAEVQAYAYAAFLAGAHLADEIGDTGSAEHWGQRATAIKRAFNERFWLPENGWFAVGLDRDKQPIDALTSNIGHCLWTGILDEDKAQAVAEHLLSPEMFTGWGIRTLSSAMGAFNPLSYHNGSVWPHDTAICVAGLMRYGFVDHAHRIASGLLDAAAHFEHRLPELFCGFSRGEFGGPVPYPTSCSPQAWASAAPLLLLRSLLRLQPQLDTGTVWCAPAIPDRFLPLAIRHVRLGPHSFSIDVHRDDWHLTGLEDTDIDVIRQPRPATAHGRSW